MLNSHSYAKYAKYAKYNIKTSQFIFYIKFVFIAFVFSRTSLFQKTEFYEYLIKLLIVPRQRLKNFYRK